MALAAATLALVATALSTVGVVRAIAAAEPDRAAAAELLVLINVDRASAGLAPLSVSPVALEVAEAWSAHMADTDVLAHNDYWFTKESRDRAHAGVVGENVAYNSDIADAHRRLMNSPGHRANILDGRFHQVGIGVVMGSRGSYWITQDFLELAELATTDSASPAPADAPDASPAPSSAPAPAPAPASAPPGPTAPAELAGGSAASADETPSPTADATPPWDITGGVVDPGDLALGSRSGAIDPSPRTTWPVVIASAVAAALLLITTIRLRRALRT